MKAHVQKLLMCRVKPYYIYQCDLIAGSVHLRSSVRKGLEVMQGLRGFTTGYAVPQYVIDAPGGGGKVPVNPDYVLSRNADRVVIRNFEGRIFEYPEAPDGTPLVARPTSIEEPALAGAFAAASLTAMPRESQAALGSRLERLVDRLRRAYPDAHCELAERQRAAPLHAWLVVHAWERSGVCGRARG